MANIRDIQFEDSEGNKTSLNQITDEKIVVVNVASACGLTRHYSGLQELADSGHQVVAFPCNQFGGQEPGTIQEICEFASSKYSVTFPIMAKIEVNGDSQIPLYTELNKATDSEGHSGEIRWNFEKFIVDADGNVSRFAPATSPSDLPL